MPSLFLGSTQAVGEITWSNAYTEPRQVGSVREESHVEAMGFGRAIPLREGASATQLRKIVAVQEDGTVWPDVLRNTKNPIFKKYYGKSPDF